VRAWPRRASRACLMGNTVRYAMLWRQGIGNGTRSHDWELDELESMKILCRWEASRNPAHRRWSP
jgi:hypothetical protein